MAAWLSWSWSAVGAWLWRNSCWVKLVLVCIWCWWLGCTGMAARSECSICTWRNSTVIFKTPTWKYRWKQSTEIFLIHSRKHRKHRKKQMKEREIEKRKWSKERTKIEILKFILNARGKKPKRGKERLSCVVYVVITQEKYQLYSNYSEI